MVYDNKKANVPRTKVRGTFIFRVENAEGVFFRFLLNFSFIISVFAPRRTLVRLNGAKNEDSHENLLFKGCGVLTVLCANSISVRP